uniref:Uncharacterized protein n=1 Tax=Mola mola TaxID=94237 RepID=A0A3Q3WMU2_MOLML
MKQRIRVVVVENEKLHSDLKSKALDESLKDYTIQNSMVKCCFSFWDLSVSQKECEEVKVRLRHREKQDALKDNGAPCVAGICLKCAKHEAGLAGPDTNLYLQAIDKLTKDRDELLLALQTVRASLQEAKQKEWSACLRVKQAVEVAEEANLSKARVRETYKIRPKLLSSSIFPFHVVAGHLWQIFCIYLLTSSSLSLSISVGQEVERLNSELVGCRQHLKAVQKDGSQWQAEALSLAEQLANAQRQLHLTRYDMQQLALEKQHLEETVKSLRARCADMEEQCVQHGRMHQRMKDRLQQLDRHCQSSAQQVCELLAKQNQLMQERKMLTEEIQNLHTEQRLFSDCTSKDVSTDG